jgi:glycosyltransferase involved in cell wall biosynthesis
MDASNIRVGLAAVIVGVPAIVLSGRSVAPDHFQIFQPYMRAGYRALLKQRRVTFLNNSRAGAKDYARWLQIPADAIEIIHNGFEFPENVVSIRAATRAQLGLKENDILLGGVLRFSEEKRPDLWVEVAQRFVKADPSYRAICFGDGPMREALLSKIERAGLGGRIQLPGIVNKAWEALSAFDLFLLSSRMEGLPNVLVEAQAAGLPVISPDVGGAAETFLDQDTGLLVPNDSPTELAKACLELARDRDRRAGMGRRAAAYARQEFSAERMVERTRAVYEGAGSMWEG